MTERPNEQDFGIRRYVVLHHTGGAGEPHYDFLFETSDTASLVTFRLPEWPLRDSPREAIKLRDHRRFYLTHEGSIGGDRGHVSRVAEGDAHVVARAGGWLLNRPEGDPFLRFEPIAGADEWRVDAF